MSSLAESLNTAQPTGQNRGSQGLVEKFLETIDGDDRAALEAALVDVDVVRRCFRVGNFRLSNILTDAGHKISEGAVANYRRKHNLLEDGLKKADAELKQRKS